MTIICPYDELTLVKILERQLSFSYCEIVHSPDLGQNPFSFKNFDDFSKNLIYFFVKMVLFFHSGCVIITFTVPLNFDTTHHKSK